MHRVDQDSFARDIALELSGVWNKIDFCWQVRCPTCAKHHAKCADRKQARIIKGTRGGYLVGFFSENIPIPSQGRSSEFVKGLPEKI